MAFVYWYVRDFFLFVADLIKFIVSLIVGLIGVLVGAVKFLISVVGSLPTLLTVSAIALIIVCVLYKVLGRESAG